MKKYLIFVFLLIAFLLNPGKILAQEMALGVYPPLLEVTIQPGRTITQVYQILNQGKTDLVITSRIVPFKPTDEIGQIQLEENQISPAIEWFSFQNADLNLGDHFVLKADSEQQVVLKVRVPQEAKEDDYYLTLLFESDPEFNLGESATQAKIKIGANLLFTVSETGEPPRKAEIAEFKVQNGWLKIGSWQLVDSFTNPLFVLRLKNIGRSLFKPMGSLTVTGFSGQKYLLDLLPENILVNSIRQIQCFSADKNQALPCRLNLNWKTKFLIGPYQAKVTFGLDKVGEDYSQTIRLFAFPFLLIGGFFFLFFVFWLVKKRI